MRELSVYLWSAVGERLALDAISLSFLKVRGVLHSMKKVQNWGDPTCAVTKQRIEKQIKEDTAWARRSS